MAKSIWPSPSVGSKKQFARPSDSAAAVRKAMIRPHNRKKTDVSCSLHSSDLLLNVPARVETWSVAEPALEQLRNNEHSHLSIARESLELVSNGVGVMSTQLAAPRIETVGCIFDITKPQ